MLFSLRFFDLKKLSYFFFVGVAFTNCDWPEDFPGEFFLFSYA